MATVDAGSIKKGMKLEIDNNPYNVLVADIVKPGKGQAFTRTKLRNLRTRQQLEKTFKSNEKVQIADINETNMRLIYVESDGATFMDDHTFEQVTIPFTIMGEDKMWLKEEILYALIFYNGEVLGFEPPNFMELIIKETMPGDKGNTASGKVTKPATLETDAEIQVPIFISEGEKVRVDTRTKEYVSRC
ncbi:MAG: Elongation factor P [Chlamydiia bacterium]|nr:Elongation factor P [Chlamydiia bacterium]